MVATPLAPAAAQPKAPLAEGPQPGGPGFEELAYAYDRLAKGDLDGAIRFARRARELSPDAEAPVRVLADALSKAGQDKEALDVANAYASSHKPSSQLLAQRGYLRSRLKDEAGAESDLRSARQSGGLSKEQDTAAAASLFDLALSPAYRNVQLGKFEEAIVAAEKARKLDPDAEAPVRIIVEAYSRMGRTQQALAEADRYIADHKASGKLYAQRGYLRRATKDVKGAQEDFETALATNDNDESDTGRMRDALGEAKKAGSPGYAEIERAYKAIEIGDFSKAADAAREARSKDPKAEAPVLILMSALNRLKQPQAAIDEANRFISGNQPSAALLAQRGYLRRATKDLKGAAEDFKAALARQGLPPAQEKRIRLALSEAERAQNPGAAPASAPAQAEPTASPLDQALNRAYEAYNAGDMRDALLAAREAASLDPKAEQPPLIAMNALTRLGRKGEALAEANRFLSRNKSADVYAQRGFLRRQTKDVSGAIADFSEALKLGTLKGKQRTVVAEALNEARYFIVADKAFKASAARDWPAALRYSRQAQALGRADEAMYRVTIEALAQLGRVDDALQASNALIANGKASGQAYAQRGYLHARMEDHAGAVSDFSTALAKGGLPPQQRLSVARGLSFEKAKLYEANGEPERALAELGNFCRAYPHDAEGWSTLGQFHHRYGHHARAVAAYENSLAIERRGEVLLNAGYASVYVNRAQESKYFREAIDRWSSDPSLKLRPALDEEVVRTQITDAEWSVRTNVVFGAIVDRSKRWGGHQIQPSFETAMRFDGRYLPYLFGLETFVGGFWSQDQTRFTEAFSRIGLRVRPFDGVDFSISGEYQHHFAGGPPNQFALSWGYGYGGFAYSSTPSAAAQGATQPTMMAYPFQSGWQPLTSFATYGTFRTGESRYLQNATGLLGYAYWSRNPRFVIGPTAMAMASYDSADRRRSAFGVGPGVVFRAWLGGDDYRAFDGLVTLQLGYLFPFGESRRLGGLNATLGVTF
ncbi:MAG: hypothetical protein CTY15_07490 [Methylocystis sp.]|nr:MAG: hypothetical protein CTY15_07490 [Methylocystis sp.]